MCHVTVGFHVLCVDLSFHVVIGVGRLTVQQEGFIRQLHFTTHTQFQVQSSFLLDVCSPTLSCHRQLNLYSTFLHISHRENGSFEVLSLHIPFQHSHCTFVIILFIPFLSAVHQPDDVQMSTFPQICNHSWSCRTSILEGATFHRMNWCKFL